MDKESFIEVLKDILNGKIKYKNTLENVGHSYFCKFPTDYKTLVETLQDINSDFCIDDFYNIFNLYGDYEIVACTCYAYLLSKSQFPEYYPYDVYPEKDGILACGNDIDGDEIYFKTASNPQDWTIVVYDRCSGDHYEYNMGIVEFLYLGFTQTIDCPIFYFED